MKLTATNLGDLLEELREIENNSECPDTLNPFEWAGVDICDLPTFGGDEPTDTIGIYSWGEDDLLVQNTGTGDFEIVSRSEYAGEE